MTDNAKKEIAALRAEVEALKAKLSPPKSDFVPETDEQHRDRMHQMRERRMAHAMHPSVVRDLNVIPDDVCKDIVARGGIRGPGGKS
jgi:hypothetical protein